MDENLAPILDALTLNPLGFPVVPGLNAVYLARTSLAVRQLELIPSYRVWFRVDEKARRVHLLFVEMAPPEDMQTDDEPLF